MMTHKLCVDFRELNKKYGRESVSSSSYCASNRETARARYFISLDMASDFHQIPSHPNSTEYTALVIVPTDNTSV